MNIPTETKKQKAIELMTKLDIYKPYIKGFEKDNKICYFENYGGFWAEQEPELMAKIQEFEKEHHCLVYAITHEFIDTDECYDFLCIPDCEENCDGLFHQHNDMHYVFAHIWNKTYDECYEFGVIGVKSFGGGIKRVT